MNRKNFKEFIDKYYIFIYFTCIHLFLFSTLLIITNTLGILVIPFTKTFTLFQISIPTFFLCLLIKCYYFKHTKTYSDIIFLTFILSLIFSVLIYNPTSNFTGIDLEKYKEYIDLFFLFASFTFIISNYKSVRENKQKIKISNKLAIPLLLLILLSSTLIKAPFFSKNFTMGHPMKYNTYVEPAKYMVENKDFLWYQQKYMANPISNPEGIYSGIPQLPILEWLLASVYTAMPFNSIEVNTRLLTHTLGLLTLVFAFLLVRKWSDNFYALIVTTLLSVNQIFVFSFFVTVYDGFNFMILLAALYFLTCYLDSENNWGILLSAILIGIGSLAKMSLLVLALPTTLFVVFKKSKDITKFLSNTLHLYTLFAIFYLSNRTTTLLLKTNPLKGISFLLLNIIFLILLHFLFSKYNKQINKIFVKLKQKRILIPIVITSILVVIYFSLNYLLPKSLVGEFLTEENLLFNFLVYKNMFQTQFIPFLGKNTFALFLPGFFILLLSKKSNMKFLTIIFLTTSLFFWVIASKSMFFHNYYTIPIMFSMILVVSVFIFYTTPLIPSTGKKLLFFILLYLLLLSPSVSTIKNILSRERAGFKEAAKYLEENTEENDFYFDEGYILTLTLETGRPNLQSINSLKTEEFRESLRELGLKGAMDKYNIKYIITPYGKPQYGNYLPLFIDMKDYPLKGKGREQMILERTNSSPDINTEEDYNQIEFLINEYKIKEKIVLEKKIGEYSFFRFVD